MTDGHGSGLRARVRAFWQRREPAGERGITLVEILVGVVVLGALTVAMVGSLYTISYVSDQQRNISVAEAEGRRLVEQIRALGYVKCPADANDADQSVRYPMVFNPGDNASGLLTAQITSIEYWDGTGLSATSAKSQPNFTSTCTRDCGLQKISLRVTTQDSQANFVFFKRNETTEDDPNCLS
jgi:type II secretory pathway pseudopilin PulG